MLHLIGKGELYEMLRAISCRCDNIGLLVLPFITAIYLYVCEINILFWKDAVI